MFRGLILVLLWPFTALAEPVYFGYAAIECGLDDVATPEVEDGYSAEVAGFTNMNMACVDADPAVTAARIKALDAIGSEIVLNVEPALFEDRGLRLAEHPERDQLWPLVLEGIAQSGVSPERIVIYLVDEPALRNLPPRELAQAAAFVQTTLPGIRTMIVDAVIRTYETFPASVTYWGFGKYLLRDPAKDAAFVATLDRAALALGPGQGIMLVIDATHFQPHQDAGLTEEDMADVARAYLAWANARGDIAGLLGYSWVGGIDLAEEKGVRNMPAVVRAAHQDIGRAILGP